MTPNNYILLRPYSPKPAKVPRQTMWIRAAALGISIVLSALTLAAQDKGKQDKQQLPDAAGKDVVQRVCNSCHGAEIVLGRGLTRDGWTQVVGDMVQRGAQGSEDDFAQIVDYLATNFPPKSDDASKDGASKSGTASTTDAPKKVNINKASADDLKAGLDFSSKEADAVVTYRGQNGDFKSIDDIKKVPGLDASKVDAVKDRLSF